MCDRTKQKQLEQFINGYIESLFFCEELEFLCDYDDIQELSKKSIDSDCEQFFNEAYELIVESGMPFGDAGHNFNLSRNGHGSGFWDRKGDKPTLEKLHKLAQSKGAKTLIKEVTLFYE